MHRYRSNVNQGGLESGVSDNFGEGEEKTNGGLSFYINKSGLPMDNSTWERMWTFVMTNHPDGPRAFRGIRDERRLPEVPFPHAPLCFPADIPMQNKIDAVQHYFQQLQYNHTGTQFFDIKKSRPLCGLMECAKDMIRESLPIKCLEAVILAIYLTNSLTSIDRFPISFRSKMKGNVYRHVVLGLHYNGRYGALGLSRRDDLMYKPFNYCQLSEMIINYQNSYQKYCHTLDKVKIGLSVPHDACTYETIQWRALCLKVTKLSSKELCREVDNFSREIRRQSNRWQATSVNAKVERARSLSPKKPIKPVNCASTVPPVKHFSVTALMDRYVQDNTSSSSFNNSSSSEPDVVLPQAPRLTSQNGVFNNRVGGGSAADRRSSYSSTFSFTELYDLRI